MASTSTSTFIQPDSNHSRLTSSVSSLSSQNSPSITQIYKEASNLFLTRRIQEALQAIQPLLQPDSNSSPSVSPITTASRGARIKVWSLYCSILNEIVEMGPDEGKRVYGAAQWKALAAKARDGTVWEEVVQDGYYGNEGEVDADVVATLATLLLAHAPTQKLTQQRLEAYLSATGTSVISPSSIDNALNRPKPSRTNTNGTSTPRDLASRLKILEIYTLHVLPRNEEWAYAREFINMSEVLDDDRREAFLQALQNLQDENGIEARREAELARQREMQMDDAKRQEREAADKERKLKDMQAKAEADVRKRRQERESGSSVRNIEHDFGMDKSPKVPRKSPNSRPSATAHGNSTIPTGAVSGGNKRGEGRVGPAAKPATYYRRASLFLDNLQRMIIAMGNSMRANPALLLRVLAFLVAFIMAFARRDVRDRVRGARDAAWDKLRSTVGMGVKVSYI